MAPSPSVKRRVLTLGLTAAVLVAGIAGLVALKRGRAPDLPTAEVTKGDFVEVVETRGDVRPFRSVLVTAPFAAGELQILKLAANGATVKQGDVVADFDALTLRRTVQDKQGELRQAQAELNQAVEQADRGLSSLQVKAPADGTVNILQNWRTSNGMGPAQEFKPGDKAWAGAQILELPDLTSVHLMSHIDESDRGQLKTGQTATVRIDAVPDRSYTATIADISVLARVDFSSGWPPAKNFDLTMTINDADTRLRPGMSGVARIAVGKIPDQLLVPSNAIFPSEGRLVVFKRSGSSFDPVPVEIVRRGREQVAVKADLKPGDHVSLVQPKPNGSQAK